MRTTERGLRAGRPERRPASLSRDRRPSLFGILQVALILRIILLLLVANPGNDVVALILNITDPFVEPFRGMFSLDRVTADQGSVLDVAAIVALIGWTLVEAAHPGRHPRSSTGVTSARSRSDRPHLRSLAPGGRSRSGGGGLRERGDLGRTGPAAAAQPAGPESSVQGGDRGRVVAAIRAVVADPAPGRRHPSGRRRWGRR